MIKKNTLSNSFSATSISYERTGYFSKIVTDYISQNQSLLNFFKHPVSLKGIQSAISDRKKFNTNRQLLVEQLLKQYTSISTSDKVNNNIRLLANDNTFTICTAHQPNIFTGHLYFIYKILHVIKLADHLKLQLPANNFVPVFYMGSEDADLDELGHIYINGYKYEWHTKQTGAVGRMKVDDELLKIIDSINGQLFVEPHGKEIIDLVKSSYTKNCTIQEATFKLVNSLFADYGLIVLLPDNAALKKTMSKIFEDDLLNNTSSEIVSKTSEQLQQHYKVQAQPRNINLFYLKDDVRERIVKLNSKSARPAGGFKILNSKLEFTEAEIIEELKNYPERFSPNVILRGLYQEMILPNIAFIGGGGEVAYWLQLKDLFEHYQTPFPVLIIRNSFVIIEKKVNELIKKLSLAATDIFKPENELINELVKKNSDHKLNLNTEKEQTHQLYQHIKQQLQHIDVTLQQHAEALQVKTLKTLDALEKKILRSEKIKYEAQQRQIQKIKAILFPKKELQERVDNFMPYYAKWESEFIKMLYQNSLTLEQQFCIIQTG